MSLTLVDNPGGGDCGAYAFALGLFDLAHQHGRRDLLNTWKTLDPGISSQLDNSSAHPSNLKPFMESIRGILFNDFLSTQPCSDRRLPSTFYIRAGFNSLIFDEFSHLCTWYYLQSKFPSWDLPLEYQTNAMNSIYLYYYGYAKKNKIETLVDQLVQLAISEDIIQSANSPVVSIRMMDNKRWNQLVYAALIKHPALFREFYQNIYNRNGIWLTDSSLKSLAELFKVEIRFETIGLSQNFPLTPFIYLKNCGNWHWQTYLYKTGFSYPSSTTNEWILCRSELDFRFTENHRKAFHLNKSILSADFSEDITSLPHWEVLYHELLILISQMPKETDFKPQMNQLNSPPKQILEKIKDIDFFRYFYNYLLEKSNAYELPQEHHRLDLEIASLRVRICLNPAMAKDYQILLEEVTERKLNYLAELERTQVDDFIQKLDITVTKLPKFQSPVWNFFTTSDSQYFFKSTTSLGTSSPIDDSSVPTQYRFLGGMFGVFIGAGISLGCKAVISALASALMLTNPPVIIVLMFLTALTGFLIGYYGFDQKPSLGPK